MATADSGAHTAGDCCEAYAQSVTVFHRGAASEHSRASLPGSDQFGLGVGGVFVRVVASLVSFEVHPRITATLSLAGVLGPETLQRSPRLVS